MKKFTALYFDIDGSTKTNSKLDALRRYFASVNESDASWALFFLAGRTLPRAVNTAVLRTAIAEAARLPLWLVEECYDAVGDLAETLALLAPDRYASPEAAADISLTDVVEKMIIPLRQLSEEEKVATLVNIWSQLDVSQRLIWNKLITGTMRIGVSRTLVERALADLAGVSQATMAHRLMGGWEPSAAAYRSLISGDQISPIGQPYPFMLANPLEADPESLGPIGEWIAEWKWDGIRAQIIRRSGEVMIWSRGEERITEAMPEIQAIGNLLPEGCVVDGEILAWKDSKPLPFALLQRRLNRKAATGKLLSEAPLAFVAYDLMEYAGKDIRQLPLIERKQLMETVVMSLQAESTALQLSPMVGARSWEELSHLRELARDNGSEGLMLKRRNGEYGTGRQRGNWWKWKIDPFTVDAVLVYAQAGHGRRASLFTDYTFAVWQGGTLLPIAKAYSGLTDAEIKEVDTFVRRHTLEKHGPVRVVEPTMVFEIAFEGIQLSSRHKSGIAVRFPRIARIRYDKAAGEADTLENVKRLLLAGGAACE